MEKYDGIGDHIGAMVDAAKFAIIGAVFASPLLIALYFLA